MKRILPLTLLALAAVGVWLIFRLAANPILDDYPELRNASAGIVGTLDYVLDAETEDSTGFPDLVLGEDKAQKLRETLDAAGPGAQLAALRVLADRLTRPSIFQPDDAYLDGERLPLAAWLADHPTPSIDRILLRMLSDRPLGPRLRVAAAVGLCRTGNRVALEAISDVLLDPDEDSDLKVHLLCRLPRIDERPPERIADLLYLPFGMVDELSAAAFACLGDRRAAGLVLDSLDRDWSQWDQRPALLAKATIAIAGSDQAVRDAATSFIAHQETSAWIGEVDMDARTVELGRLLVDAFRTWLERNPQALDSAFDRERRAYLSSDRRERELAIDSFEAILDTPEEDLEGIEEPEEILALLADRLLRSQGTVEQNAIWPEQGLPFALPHVFRVRVGNCLGLSTLYLAVAERLDLPLHLVATPGHVFVRWDDGRTRRNVELTDGGACHPDEYYHDLGPGLRIGDDKGEFLTNLPRKKALSYVLVNLSDLYLSPFYKVPDNSLIAAERAVLLHPKNGAAWLSLGMAKFRVMGAAEEAIECFERAMELRPLSLEGRIAMAEANLALDRIDMADHWLGRASEMAPDDHRIHVGRIRCLLRSDQPGKAAGAAEAAIEELGAGDFTALWVQALILAGDPDWKSALDDHAPDPKAHPDLWLLAAESHMEITATHPADPISALRVLAELSWIADTAPQEDPDDFVCVSEESGVTYFEGGRGRYDEVLHRVEAALGE